MHESIVFMFDHLFSHVGFAFQSLISRGIRFPGRDNESLAPIFTPQRSVLVSETDASVAQQIEQSIPVQSFTAEQTKEAFDVARNGIELLSTVLTSSPQQDALRVFFLLFLWLSCTVYYCYCRLLFLSREEYCHYCCCYIFNTTTVAIAFIITCGISTRYYGQLCGPLVGTCDLRWTELHF